MEEETNFVDGGGGVNATVPPRQHAAPMTMPLRRVMDTMIIVGWR